MYFKLFTATVLAFALLTHSGSAQRLDKFATSPNANRAVVYKQTLTYFGYIGNQTKPDETVNDKKYYHLYFFLPDSTDEIAVRMFSPVPAVIMPDQGDLVSEDYYEHEKEYQTYFDTWLAIDKAELSAPYDSTIKLTWLQLGFNDDSAELFAQPSGKYHNSVLRLQSKPKQPHLFAPGLYRIRFTDNKQTDLSGSFAVQVGFKNKMPGLQLVKNQKDLTH